MSSNVVRTRERLLRVRRRRRVAPLEALTRNCRRRPRAWRPRRPGGGRTARGPSARCAAAAGGGSSGRWRQRRRRSQKRRRRRTAAAPGDEFFENFAAASRRTRRFFGRELDAASLLPEAPDVKFAACSSSVAGIGVRRRGRRRGATRRRRRRAEKAIRERWPLGRASTRWRRRSDAAQQMHNDAAYGAAIREGNRLRRRIRGASRQSAWSRASQKQSSRGPRHVFKKKKAKKRKSYWLVFDDGS